MITKLFAFFFLIFIYLFAFIRIIFNTNTKLIINKYNYQIKHRKKKMNFKQIKKFATSKIEMRERENILRNILKGVSLKKKFVASFFCLIFTEY